MVELKVICKFVILLVFFFSFMVLNFDFFFIIGCLCYGDVFLYFFVGYID